MSSVFYKKINKLKNMSIIHLLHVFRLADFYPIYRLT